MIKTLLFSILLLTSFAQAKNCSECKKIESLTADLDKTHKNFLEHAEEAKKVEDGPSEEQKALEVSSANVYKYVCDFEVKKSSAEDKLALSNLVIHVYDLKIEDALIADMFSCFYQKHQALKKEFTQVEQKAKITSKMDLVLKEGARHEN